MPQARCRSAGGMTRTLSRQFRLSPAYRGRGLQSDLNPTIWDALHASSSWQHLAKVHFSATLP